MPPLAPTTRPPLARHSWPRTPSRPARSSPRPPRAAAGQQPPQPNSAASAAARRAFALVDTLMADVAREVWVDTAVDSIVARQVELATANGETVPDGTTGPSSAAAVEAAAIARVAAAAAEKADTALLAALGVAADAAADAGDGVSAARLTALRNALVDATVSSLPPETRVLDAVARVESPREREALVAEAIGCGAGERDTNSSTTRPHPLPRVDAGALYSAACQLIDDLESHQVVPDGVLLRRLVLAREDVRSAADCGRLPTAADVAGLNEAVSAHGTALHSGAAQLARAVVAASSAEERRELVAAALRGDMEEAATLPGRPTPGAAAALSPRPGRVLTALAALAAGLRDAGDSERAELLASARADAVALLTGAAY